MPTAIPRAASAVATMSALTDSIVRCDWPGEEEDPVGDEADLEKHRRLHPDLDGSVLITPGDRGKYLHDRLLRKQHIRPAGWWKNRRRMRPTCHCKAPEFACQ
jgi:hypothetical protein